MDTTIDFLDLMGGNALPFQPFNEAINFRHALA
jgi:hypothetical protein